MCDRPPLAVSIGGCAAAAGAAPPAVGMNARVMWGTKVRLVALDRRAPSLQLSPAAPEVTSHRCPRRLNCLSRVRLTMSHGRRGAMSRWGPASRSPIPGIDDPGPMAPPPTEAPPDFRYHRRALARSLGACRLALRHVRNFPSSRAGTLNHGDVSLPYSSI